MITGKMLYLALIGGRDDEAQYEKSSVMRSHYDRAAQSLKEQLQLEALLQLIRDYRAHSDVLLACLEQESEALTNYNDELHVRGAKLGLWSAGESEANQ